MPSVVNQSYNIILPNATLRNGIEITFSNWSALIIDIIDNVNNLTFKCYESLILRSNGVAWLSIFDSNFRNNLNVAGRINCNGIANLSKIAINQDPSNNEYLRIYDSPKNNFLYYNNNSTLGLYDNDISRSKWRILENGVGIMNNGLCGYLLDGAYINSTTPVNYSYMPIVASLSAFNTYGNGPDAFLIFPGFKFAFYENRNDYINNNTSNCIQCFGENDYSFGNSPVDNTLFNDIKFLSNGNKPSENINYSIEKKYCLTNLNFDF
jgi:hypothetical protein